MEIWRVDHNEAASPIDWAVMKRVAAVIAFMVFILVGLTGVGCASSTGPVTVTVPPGRYAEAFAITKDEIRRLGFQLARIDARNGVITSQTHSTGGLATPWLPNEATFGDRVESLLHRDQRRIVVTFDLVDGAAADVPVEKPAEAESAPTDVDANETASAEKGLIGFGPVPPDRRSWEGELICRVSVPYERLHRSGLRLSPVGIRLSNVTSSSEESESGQPATIVREMEPDTNMAAKLAGMIRDRLASEMSKKEKPGGAARD